MWDWETVQVIRSFLWFKLKSKSKKAWLTCQSYIEKPFVSYPLLSFIVREDLKTNNNPTFIQAPWEYQTVTGWFIHCQQWSSHLKSSSPHTFSLSGTLIYEKKFRFCFDTLKEVMKEDVPVTSTSLQSIRTIPPVLNVKTPIHVLNAYLCLTLLSGEILLIDVSRVVQECAGPDASFKTWTKAYLYREIVWSLETPVFRTWYHLYENNQVMAAELRWRQCNGQTHHIEHKHVEL